MDEVSKMDEAELGQLVTAWQAVAATWDLTAKDRVELLPGHAEDEPPAGETLTRMRLLVEIGHRLQFESDLALRDWLRKPMLLFAFDAPLDVMGGSLEQLLRFRGLVERGLGS